ncbi:MAG: RibD family protein [Actinobacteria bacterium]|nr:RibD family protein [Actinomycetota bacterium]MBU1945134.1 RibD family protein [Actinomycetota bacterium]MBU2686415.1 RibD family protein [Actinomycetota bacterium]
MLPEVTIHNAVSIDGRLTGFMPDMGLYYELAGAVGENATLCGADTILAGLEEFGDDAGSFSEDLPPGRRASLPLLVVTDSRGRVRSWEQFLRMPFWRSGVSLCAESTPPEHLDYLDGVGIEVIRAGEVRVDLRAALEELSSRFGVERVRVDSGGSLNGALLKEGLVSEVSALVSPLVVGDSQVPFFYGAFRQPVEMELLSAEELRGDHVLLRYRIT